jgi:hypothetical protein
VCAASTPAATSASVITAASDGAESDAVVARDVQLDRVAPLAQAEPRHAPHLVGTVDGDAEAVLVQVQAPSVAQAAGDRKLGTGGQHPRSVAEPALDGVAHRDVEPNLGRRRRARAGEAGAQQLARGVHGEQRMVLRRQLAERRAARRVDEREMGVTFDQPRHQEPSVPVESFGAIGGGDGLGGRRHSRDAFAFDQHLPGNGAAPLPSQTVACSISRRFAVIP